MLWEKLGHVFVADNHSHWMKSHAAWPRPLHLRGNLFRIFFSVRDVNNFSSVAFVDIDIKMPTEVLEISKYPVLSPGAPGVFDENGVIPSCIVKIGEKTCMYYSGVSVLNSNSFECFCGLSFLDSNFKLSSRYTDEPILKKNSQDPHSTGLAFVLKDCSYEKFHMWYESGSYGKKLNNKETRTFTIKYATSLDGINWERKNTCFSPANEYSDEYLSSPSVIYERGIFKMWYSFKNNGKYSIGYAESIDGVEWERMDKEVGITISRDGWDSEEIEYSYVFDHLDDRYMLYNGNNFGRSGFGIAKLTEAL